MKLVPRSTMVLVALGLATSALAVQQSRQFQLPPVQSPVQNSYENFDAKHEFAWSRLQYTPLGGARGGFGAFGYGGGGAWSRDYPKADITFLAALRRLTRVDARSYQQVVNLRTDDIFNYPFVYAVQVEAWTFTEEEANRLREYLLKGGFLMVDDFHGTRDWDSFLRGIRMVLPADKYPITDLTDNDEIFHVLYDIGKRFQVPGEQYVVTGRTYEQDGYVDKWRAIRDDKGRVIVAICHNMHLGDAWEWADSADYPEPFASMAFRVGIDYVMYSMTH
jgi:Domain of unknown function (DUF4159)